MSILFSVLHEPAQLFKKAVASILFEQLAAHSHDNTIPLKHSYIQQRGTMPNALCVGLSRNQN